MTPALPPGFQLDSADAAPPPPPPGFQLDSADAAPIDPNLKGVDAGLARLGQQNTLKAPAAPQAAPDTGGYTGKILGAVEAALNVVSGLTTGVVGQAGGLIGGVAGALATGTFGTPQAANEIERTASEAGQKVTYEPQTGEGQAAVESVVAPAMQAAAPLMGHMGEMGAMHAGAAHAIDTVVKPAARAVGNATGKAAAKVLGVDPELAKVAQIAGDLKHPIDVRPDQVIEHAKFSKLAGQAASDVPLANSKTKSNQVAFTRNVIDAINPEETADRLTPETFDKAMTRSGAGIGEIMGKTEVPLDGDMRGGLDALREDAEKFATDNDKRILGNYIDELKSKADDAGIINGTALKELNSEIGARARVEVDNDLGRRLNDLQDIIQDGVEKNISDPADAKALKDFRRQYAYGKIVEPLVAKTIDGKISPQGLMARVTATKQGKQYMARSAAGPIGDLAKVGQLIKEPASSGTAERGLVYGVGLGGGAYIEPHTAAAAYGGALAYNTLGPKLTRAMVGKRPKKAAPRPPEPPAEPTTSPGAGGPRGGPGGPPQGPLGDLTPDWTTTPGGGGGKPRGGHEPGLHGGPGETPPMSRGPKPNVPKNAGKDIPAVPGRPDLPDTMVAGRPSELAPDKATGEAMQGERSTQARRTQEAEAGARAEAGKPKAAPSAEETQRLLDTEKSPAVRAVLQKHAEKLKADDTARELARVHEEDAAAMERAARQTDDPHLQARLLKQADELRGTKPIPKGEVKEGQPDIPVKKEKVPAGEATEITPERVEPENPEIPVGEATEITPEHIEADRAWRAQFKLGEGDAARARDVAQALKHDEPAVVAAARQHENNPRAFDREIARINEEGAARADESKQPAGGGASDAGTAEGAGAPVREQADKPAGVQPQAEDHEPVSTARSGAAGEREPKPAAAVHAADEHAGTDRVSTAGAERDEAATAGGQASTGAQGKPAVKRFVPEKTDEPVSDPSSGVRKETGEKGTTEGGANGAALEDDIFHEGEKSQGKVGPIWRSPLREFIDGSKMEKGTPEQWRGFLKNAKGVKADEIKWSGIDDYLRLREGTGDKAVDAAQGDLFGVPTAKKAGVTKAEIQDFLAKGGVQITEAQMGGPWKGFDVPKELGEYLATVGNTAENINTIEAPGWRMHADSFAAQAREARASELPTLAKRYEKLHEQALQMLDAARVSDRPPPTKFPNWVMPGGENYRELLLKLESHRDETFDRGHWDQPNNIAHVRATDRVDAKGRRGLHIEEVQSDWAQKARKHGIDEPGTAEKIASHEPVDELPEGWTYRVNGGEIELIDPEKTLQAIQTHGREGSRWEARDPASHMAHAVEMYNHLGQGEAAAAGARRLVRAGTSSDGDKAVPNAPYISSTDAWSSLVLKRITKLAADEGYDFVTFANGKQNAELYHGLIKRIEKIQYDPEEGTLHAYDHDGKTVMSETVEPTVAALEEYIGHEPAEKLVRAIENGDREQGGQSEPTYDPELHGAYDVHEDEDVESRHFISDDNGDHVPDRYGGNQYFDSHHEARSALRDFSVEEGADDFYIEDHTGRTLKDEMGNERRFETREEAEEALDSFTVEEEEADRQYHLYGPDGEHIETYDSYRQADRERAQYQQEHEDRINEEEGDSNLPTISGLDMLIGDEGMREFYDRILPQNAKRVVNQLGGDGLKRIEVPSLEKNEDNGRPGKLESWSANRAATVVKNGGEIIVDTAAGYSTHVDSLAALDQLLKTSAGKEPTGFVEVQKPQLGFDITPKMREATENGVPLFKAEDPSQQPVGSAEGLDRALRDKFGDKLIQGLQDAGILKYAKNADEQPPGSRASAIMRQAGPAPAATLYFDRLSAERAPSILMHELGEHFGIVRLLGGDRYKIMLNDLADLHASKTPEIVEAWNSVKERYVVPEGSPRFMEDLEAYVRAKSPEMTRLMDARGDPAAALKKLYEHRVPQVVEGWNKLKLHYRVTEGDDLFLREVAAHLVEKTPDLPFVRRIINEIRAFFYEHFGTTMGNRVDANLIRGLAAAALRKASQGALPKHIPGFKGTPAPYRPFVPRSSGGRGFVPQLSS